MGQSKKQLEGSIESFGDGDSLRKPMNGYVAGESAEAPPEHPRGAEAFVVLAEDRTAANRTGPEIHKGDPQFLREHRVDQQDEIVAEPDAETGQEIAVLKKKSFFKKEGSPQSSNGAGSWVPG
ncbi:MAG TPA: hypothetical protein VG944_17725 [Fimbriimonas sp.]|nr:hypothetical protein [Fimbriimonas sp.]